ncbi:hypothetical protein PIB30_103440, partial [Stylosanthes scabra]|nr:hypothetical protein [Stylosanthes scabra]
TTQQHDHDVAVVHFQVEKDPPTRIEKEMPFANIVQNITTQQHNDVLEDIQHGDAAIVEKNSIDTPFSKHWNQDDLGYNSEPERTLLRRRREARRRARQAALEQQLNMAAEHHDDNLNLENNQNRVTLGQYINPTADSCGSTIKRAVIQANNFELKPSLIQVFSSLLLRDKQTSKFGVERSLYSLLLLQGKSENREIKGCIPRLYDPYA